MNGDTRYGNSLDGRGYSERKNMSIGKELCRKMLEGETLVKEKILGMGTYYVGEIFRTKICKNMNYW